MKLFSLQMFEPTFGAISNSLNSLKLGVFGNFSQNASFHSQSQQN